VSPEKSPESAHSILVVDDDEVTRQLLREVLQKEGFEVQLAGSGEEALRKFRRQAYPIVLSDIRMIELDGMGVLREVKRLSPRSAVILMTGFGSMDGAIEAIQEGAFDYVSKPFKMEDLRATVARAAKHWENQRPGAVRGDSGRLDVSGKGLIGKSPKIVEVYKTLALVVPLRMSWR
jgi:two-component system response regulator AtoC